MSVPTGGGWVWVLLAGIYFVLPVDDDRPHSEDGDCWCNPTLDDECGNVVVHHSLDGREAFEEGWRKPS